MLESSGSFVRPAYPDLKRKLVPILESIECARYELEPDSGTASADSTFIRLRLNLREQIRDVVSEFNDAAFQADVFPTGAAAMRRWREEQRSDLAPTFVEQGRADSLRTLLQRHGVWTFQVEGDTYFTVNESLLLEHLGRYLTHGMRHALEIQAIEQRKPTAQDAGLRISLSQLADRIRSAERFLEENPKAYMWEIVQSRFRWYLAVFVAGLPNSRPFDWQTDRLRDDWRESLVQYVRDHAGTKSGQVVENYLERMTANDFVRDDEIDAFLSGLWADVRLLPFP